jgi:nicotinate-nucleotide pyrophosphorylase
VLLLAEDHFVSAVEAESLEELSKSMIRARACVMMDDNMTDEIEMK